MITLGIFIFVDGKLVKIFDSGIYSNIKNMKDPIEDYLDAVFESIKE